MEANTKKLAVGLFGEMSVCKNVLASSVRSYYTVENFSIINILLRRRSFTCVTNLPRKLSVDFCENLVKVSNDSIFQSFFLRF